MLKKNIHRESYLFLVSKDFIRWDFGKAVVDKTGEGWQVDSKNQWEIHYNKLHQILQWQGRYDWLVGLRTEHEMEQQSHSEGSLHEVQVSASQASPKQCQVKKYISPVNGIWNFDKNKRLPKLTTKEPKSIDTINEQHSELLKVKQTLLRRILSRR